jgi:outer membrane immunogenic protein
MKKFLLGSILLVAALASGRAGAADLPPPVSRAAPAPVAAPVSWTGFYIGGDVGEAWSSNTATFNPLPTPGGIAFGITGLSGSDGGSALIGGFHAGYNWQFAPTWVVGLEGDWSWSKAGGSFTQNWVAIPPAVVFPPSFTTMSSRLDWVTSARPRFGYLVTPNLLAYATGGVAWAKIDYAATASGFLYLANTALSQTQTGYTVGGGLEWAMTSNWLVRAEYLFYRFDNPPNVVVPASAGGSLNPSGFLWSATNVSVARAGLSYKF